MKNIIDDFLKLLSNLILVICFAMASFLLIINFFHYKDISKSQRIDVLENADYKKYNQLIESADRNMKSVNYTNTRFINTAKPIYEYYESCSKLLKESTFEGLKDKKSITLFELYNANNEILDEYNSECIFNIVYNIEKIGQTNKYKNDFNSVKEIVEAKQNVLLDNSDYLMKSLLGNSSYSFMTNTSKKSVYNKVNNQLKLTINDYKLLASILNDISNWYALEFGGAR